MPILDILNQYGFATLAAIAMGWFIWFIYTFITQEQLPDTFKTKSIGNIKVKGKEELIKIFTFQSTQTEGYDTTSTKEVKANSKKDNTKY